MRIKKFPLLLLSLLGASHALALEFGEITVLSRLGQPFRAEIRVLEDAGDVRLGAECFSVSPPESLAPGPPSLAQGRVTLMRNGGQSRLLVVSDQVINEPVVQFNVRIVCGPLQYRSYSVLIDPVSSNASSYTPSNVVQTPSSVTKASREVIKESAGRLVAKQNTSGPEWQCAEGESARSIAASIFPSNSISQSRFLSALLNANPDLALGTYGEKRLTAGMVLRLPEIRHLPTGKSAKVFKPQIAERTPFPSIRSSSERHQAKTSIAPGASRALETPASKKTVGAPDKAVSLSPATDEKTLAEQVRALEASLSASLPATQGPVQAVEPQVPIVRVETPSASPEAVPVSPPPQTTPSPVAIDPVEKPKAPPPPAPEDASESEFGFLDWLLELASAWWLEIATVLGLTALLLFWRSMKRKDTRKKLATHEASKRDPMSILEDDVASAAKISQAPASLGLVPPDQAAAVSEYKPLPEQNPPGAVAVGQEEQEFNPVMELAEIMLSFGRVKGAAQALQEYIEKSPDEALQPWMKLLEVYRQGEMREEFEALSEKLKLHFNVAPADWASMAESASRPVTPIDEETASIEQLLEHMPNIVQMLRIRDEITRTWDSPEGIDYLNTLLRDNRKGERQGFPLATVSELLYLMDILEKRLKHRVP